MNEQEKCLRGCDEITNLLNMLSRIAIEKHDVDLISHVWIAIDLLACIRAFVLKAETYNAEESEPDYDAAREWDDEDEDEYSDEDEEDYDEEYEHYKYYHGYNMMRENP